MPERRFANTYEFLGEVFDKSVAQMLENGGRRDLNVFEDPPQDNMNGSMVWVNRAAVITFPNNCPVPNSQFVLSVTQWNFYEHPSRWEFNMADQAMVEGQYLDPQNQQLYFYNMRKNASGTSWGRGLWLCGDIGSSDLSISNDVNPDQVVDNESNHQVVSLMRRMKAVVNDIDRYPSNKRINEPTVLDACVRYVDLIRQSSIAMRPHLERNALSNIPH